MTDTNRRTFLAGAALTAGAAVTLASNTRASAQAEAATPAAPTAPGAAAYPAPPYPTEMQPWPGLASKMNPRPDHGETSYKGSGRLAGKKALITGGDSGIGRAAAIAYAREGPTLPSTTCRPKSRTRRKWSP